MNTNRDLAKYFSVPGKGVSLQEFLRFWHSLKPSEQEYYLNAPLT